MQSLPLFAIPLILVLASLANSHIPPSEVIAIYQNAPPIVKSALSNIGLGPEEEVASSPQQQQRRSSEKHHKPVDSAAPYWPQSPKVYLQPHPLPITISSTQYVYAPSNVPYSERRNTHSRRLYSPQYHLEVLKSPPKNNNHQRSKHVFPKAPFNRRHPSKGFLQRQRLHGGYPVNLNTPDVQRVPFNVLRPKLEFGGFVPVERADSAPQPRAATNLSERNHRLYDITESQVEEPETASSNPLDNHRLDDNSVLEPSNAVPPNGVYCGGNSDLGWCDLGAHYPKDEVQNVVSICEEVVNKMFAEVPEDLESLQDTSTYSLNQNMSVYTRGRSSHQPWSWAMYSNTMTSMCDVQRVFVRPSFAQDITGQWAIIVQTNKIKQRIPLEICRTPGGTCNKAADCFHKSLCVQKYSYHQLISIDTKNPEGCPFVRLYKFPSACVCHVESAAEGNKDNSVES